MPDGAARMTACGYRILFAKTEAMRFTGHLDLHRAWERLLRRAALGVAYSAGFHPHPKIQIGAALPLGVTGAAELLDVWLEGNLPAAEVFAGLAAHEPPGIHLLRARPLAVGEPGLERLIVAGEYLAEPVEGAWPADLAARIEALLAAASLPRERRGKTYDLRPRILSLALDGGMLRMRLGLEQEATGRPDEVLAALEAGEMAVLVNRPRLILRGPNKEINSDESFLKHRE